MPHATSVAMITSTERLTYQMTMFLAAFRMLSVAPSMSIVLLRPSGNRIEETESDARLKRSLRRDSSEDSEFVLICNLREALTNPLFSGDLGRDSPVQELSLCEGPNGVGEELDYLLENPILLVVPSVPVSIVLRYRPYPLLNYPASNNSIILDKEDH